MKGVKIVDSKNKVKIFVDEFNFIINNENINDTLDIGFSDIKNKNLNNHNNDYDYKKDEIADLEKYFEKVKKSVKNRELLQQLDEFIPLEGFEGYYLNCDSINNFTVAFYKKKDEEYIPIKKRIDKGNNGEDRYFVSSINGTQIAHHRLIARTFIKKDIKYEDKIDHIDGNKQNNSLMNLDVVTSAENTQRSVILKRLEKLKTELIIM